MPKFSTRLSLPLLFQGRGLVILAAAFSLPNCFSLEARAEDAQVTFTRNSPVAAHTLSLGSESEAERQTGAATVASNTPNTPVSSWQSPRMLQDVERSLLYVSSIDIQGNYRVPRSQLLQIAGLAGAPAVWQVSPEEIRRRLLNFPWIEEVEIQSHPYPATLKISVKEAEPWIIAEYERHSWLVSRKGVLLQPLDSLDNPEIILETTELARIDGLTPQPGADSYLSSANARFLEAIKLVKLIEAVGEFPFPLERYTLLPGGGLKLSAPLPAPIAERVGAAAPVSYPQVLFAADNLDEAVLRVKRLRSVLEDLNRRGEQARRIDLRFKNQVIVE